MNFQANQNIQELTKCCLGGVTLEVLAPKELHEDLFVFHDKMEVFKANGPGDLRMTILKPKPKGRSRGNDFREKLTNNLIPKMLPNEALNQKRDILLKAERRLKLLLSDPGVHDPLKLLAARIEGLSFVPLRSGFLCANPGMGEALLLLDKAWHPGGSFRSSSWWPLVNVMVMNAATAFVAIYLAQYGDGVIAHGTGVNYRGDGFLFLAPSGGGKTALSGRSAPGVVLADDGIVIRKKKDGYRLYPTPFRQLTGQATPRYKWHQDAVRLKAVFILDKGLQTRVRPILRSQTMGFLINALTHFFMWMNPAQATQVFDFWRTLGTTVPMAELEWHLGSDFWAPIDNYLKNRKKNETEKKIFQLA